MSRKCLLNVAPTIEGELRDVLVEAHGRNCTDYREEFEALTLALGALSFRLTKPVRSGTKFHRFSRIVYVVEKSIYVFPVDIRIDKCDTNGRSPVDRGVVHSAETAFQ